MSPWNTRELIIFELEVDASYFFKVLTLLDMDFLRSKFEWLSAVSAGLGNCEKSDGLIRSLLDSLTPCFVFPATNKESFGNATGTFTPNRSLDRERCLCLMKQHQKLCKKRSIKIHRLKLEVKLIKNMRIVKGRVSWRKKFFLQVNCHVSQISIRTF